VQNYLIENFHMRVFREWLSLAVLSGELSFPDYELRPERYDTPRWMPRGWTWVDPLKEVKAYREAEQAGYMTKSQIIAQSGGDYDDNVSELAREQQLAKDAGLTLDKDLGLVPGPGPSPTAPPTEPSAPDL
jgi:capsid protein